MQILPMFFGLLSCGALAALAVETRMTVRVRAKDAKFVGTSMGGAQVTVRDAATGEILAEGLTSGGTGNTQRLMKEPVPRGAVLSDEASAKFDVTLDLDRPKLVEVVARGPMGHVQAANRVSATQWIVPGRHITGGDGWMLELPGFVVDAQASAPQGELKGLPKTVTLRAHVVMMCGCPITPGGLWDAGRYEVAAALFHDGQPAGTLPLSYAGQVSEFMAEWTVTEPGAYEAVVYAYDPQNGNTGVDRVDFVAEA